MSSLSIIIESENEMRRVPIDLLKYVEVNGSLLTYYIENDISFICTGTLKKVEQKLPSFFLRINRSSLINANQIIAVNKAKRLITLSDSSVHHVSVRRLKILRIFLNANILL